MHNVIKCRHKLDSLIGEATRVEVLVFLQPLQKLDHQAKDQLSAAL